MGARVKNPLQTFFPSLALPRRIWDRLPLSKISNEMKPFVPNAHFVKFSHFQKKEKGHDPLLERHPHMMIGTENDSLIEPSTNPAYVIVFSSYTDFFYSSYEDT